MSFKYAMQISSHVKTSLTSGDLIWYLHTICLDFTWKRNELTSILTLTSNVCIPMQCGKSTTLREPARSQAMWLDKVVWWDACWKNQLTWCFQVCPKLKKTRKFTAESDKDRDTLWKFHTKIDETCLGVSRPSRVFVMCLVSNNCLRIDWLVQKCPMTHQVK